MMTLPDTDSIPSLSLSHTLSANDVGRPNPGVDTAPGYDRPSCFTEGTEVGDDIDDASDMGGLDVDDIETWYSLDRTPTTGSEVAAQKRGLENTEYCSQEAGQGDTDRGNPTPRPSKPFYRWIRTLQRRAVRRQEAWACEGYPQPYAFDADSQSSVTGSTHRRPPSSDSSFRFVSAVRSASVSLTSASVLTHSRRNAQMLSRGHSMMDRSSRASVSGARLSEDSFCPDRQVPLDPTVVERSLQRRRILEELISTEESYIGDVRFLMNVCACLQYPPRLVLTGVGLHYDTGLLTHFAGWFAVLH